MKNTELHPQAEQMADESMVRTLEAQARAIWPQEIPLLHRYRLPAESRILDAGCGTGEGASRLAEHFPRSRVLGVDVIEQSLTIARSRYAHLAPRLTFELRSVFELGLPDQSFDLTACRHVLHSIPHPDRVIAELARVTRPGGYLHLIPEDYGMIHFERHGPDLEEFWRKLAARFTAALEIDMHSGRNVFGILKTAGLENIAVDYIIVDTIRVPRPVFVAMFEAWRDGFAQPAAQVMEMPVAEVLSYFNNMIEQLRDPQRYAVWMVPVASARVTSRGQ
jgi:ubiquinone/menaquinone biosynthesis C-methylase UbiE